VDGSARANRAVLVAFCGLFATTSVWAEPLQDDQSRSKQFHDDQPRLKQKKQVVHRADPAAQLRRTMREEINNGLLGIVSEGTDYTVDLALGLAGEQNRLRLLPIAGAGALQNAKDVMFARGIDFAIVQTDALDEIKRNPPFPGVENYLQYVTRLYDQELHVLAGPEIQSFDDLAGKKVSFGPRDSGALGVQPEGTNLAHPLALDKLRRGEISALAYLATKPSRLFQDVRPDENLHFLPITVDLPPTYSPITITSDDYPELVAKDAPIKTVAVGTVLVAYNWPAKSERHLRVNRFVQAFFTHLNDIKARRPKWRDFDVTASIAGWTRFPAAEQWLKKAELTPAPDTANAQEQLPLDKERAALFREFADYQRTLAPAKAARHLDPKQREMIFRDFADYQKRQQMIVAYHGAAADH
jgi:TRAP-type uncharacterized transport system substrate-binding protein